MGKALTLTKSVFSNWNDGVFAYLNDIRRYPVMERDEEKNAFDIIKAGGPNAEAMRERVLLSNQRFIYSLAKEYKGYNVMDIISECNIGMAKALDEFDPERGVRFITFAVWYMRREVLSFITNNGEEIRTSNKQKLMGVLPRAREKFLQENGREATPEELMEILETEYGVKIKNAEDLYDISIPSINSTLTGDNEGNNPLKAEFEVKTASFNDYETQIEADEKTQMVKTLLSVGDEDEQMVMKMLYGIGLVSPLSVDEVAIRTGFTERKVSSIKKSMLKRMQEKAATIRR